MAVSIHSILSHECTLLETLIFIDIIIYLTHENKTIANIQNFTLSINCCLDNEKNAHTLNAVLTVFVLGCF